jgi:hypothetical protein
MEPAHGDSIRPIYHRIGHPFGKTPFDDTCSIAARKLEDLERSIRDQQGKRCVPSVQVRA